MMEDNPNDRYKDVFTPYITRNGKRIWAHTYGLKAWHFRVKVSK